MALWSNLIKRNVQTSVRMFDEAAAAYERAQPGYPSSQVEKLFAHLGKGETLPVIADIGAGNGLLTKNFIWRASERLFCDEPSREMRQLCKKRFGPAVTAINGTAEHTGLKKSSVDLIVAGTAAHWFEPGPTLHEFHRILKPDGKIAVFHNKPDYTQQVNLTLSELRDRCFNTKDPAALHSLYSVSGDHLIDPSGAFKDSTPHTVSFSREDLLHYLKSHRSFSPWAREHPQETMERIVEPLFDRFAGGRETLELPWVSNMLCGDLLPDLHRARGKTGVTRGR